MFVCVRACVRACVCVCVCGEVYLCVRACVYARARECVFTYEFTTSHRYAYHMGTQTSDVFSRFKNHTLDLNLKLMPQYMKDLGYHTHMVGKWHLGFCTEAATPTGRG